MGLVLAGFNHYAQSTEIEVGNKQALEELLNGLPAKYHQASWYGTVAVEVSSSKCGFAVKGSDGFTFG